MAEQSIGALWENDGKNGTYFTGNIELDGVKKKIVVFKNSYKKDKQPDWRIFKSKPKEERSGGEQAEAVSKVFDDDLPDF
jgi:hypothetical protein